MHNQRKWMQILCGRVDVPFGLYEYHHLRGTHLTLLGLPVHDPPEYVDRTDEPVEPRASKVLNEVLGPSYLAGEVIGHLFFVLQNDGAVTVVDLRCDGRDGVAPRGFLFNLNPTGCGQPQRLASGVVVRAWTGPPSILCARVCSRAIKRGRGPIRRPGRDRLVCA
ncbi:hypothetical protein BCR44DRAFT_1009307 [Catenaria anguillulae PL171]|uniref:Uncharacterized protein n=1 Tax=Catenaria anguillulae PL171 TaxID=765915 RepID=A0A1Y2I3U2_9FUNG|nr:hypothetical protein BCR44DRAFT_1009307 [Catenaria anguillulae PL171]